MDIPPQILKRLKAIKAKRARTVIRHIVRHGSITSLDLLQKYGYEHPPRAIRDVRELGIPIITHRTKANDGKTIATYKFGDLTQWTDRIEKGAGRTALTKALKAALIEKYGARCFVYLEEMKPQELQVDHRIPYEIGGEADQADIDAFMLLCPSANRAKSWTCEHCENWTRKDVSFCMKCFWAHPEEYDHVAGNPQKLVCVMFSGDEIEDYRKLIALAGKDSAQTTIKRILHERLG